MEAARPRGRRRRGTVARPLNARLVRVSSLVIVPAALALLFSISTTGTLPRPTLDPLFDASVAATVATELATEFPSRVPGTDEAAGAALWYGETMSALGLTVEEDVWRADLVDLGEVELRNIVTIVPGRSEEAIVLVAHRDNSSGYGDNASGTAALVELARGFARQGDVPAPLLERTLIFLSTDAGAYGGAGAVRFAAHVAARRPGDRCDRPGRDRRARETASRHLRGQFEFTRAHAGQHGVGAGHRAGRAAAGDLVVALAARRSRNPVRSR